MKLSSKVLFVAAGVIFVGALATTPVLADHEIPMPSWLQPILDAINSQNQELVAHDANQSQEHLLLTGKLDMLQASVNNIALSNDHTGLPPTWDKLLTTDAADPCSSTRFTCVMDGAAVRDNETGLVWARTPWSKTYTWAEARYVCPDAKYGGRKGWRLPSVHELNTLVDPSQSQFTGTPTLYSNSPFTGVLAEHYWTATEFAVQPAVAWWVNFLDGNVGNSDKLFSYPVWCVRGAGNAASY